MLKNYDFSESGNRALAEMELPPVLPEEVPQIQTRIKKLASIDDFEIRWGLKGRKQSENKEIVKRRARAHDNFETEKEFAKFEKVFEEFVHPEEYWESEDGEWDGLFDDSMHEWYKNILDEIFSETEKISTETLRSITENQIHEFCCSINTEIALRSNNNIIRSQIRNIPQTFPTTLWADVIEFTRLYIQLEKTGQAPELHLGKEEFIEFTEGEFKRKPHDSMQEFVSRWNPEKNSYRDECSRIRTEEFARRMRSVQETHVHKGTNYITQITRKSLYQALRGDLADFLQKNARSHHSERAIRETREYFKSEQILLAVMKRVEDAFKNYHGPDRIEFLGGMQLSEEEKTRIETIQSVQGPVDGNMG